MVACNTGSSSPDHQNENDDPYSDILSDLSITTRSFQMGTAGFIPKHYPDSADEDWRDFLEYTPSSYGEIFGVPLDPGDSVNEDGITWQAQLAFEQVKEVEPYVALVTSFEEGPFTVERGEELKQMAMAVIAEYQPKYLSLGIESNLLYLFQQDSFELYVQFARETYDEIKAVSPNTQVINNFQLEHMKGKISLTNQEIEANWQILDLFEGKMDLISFTVYPFLEYQNVDEIPSDYLAEIRDHTSLPIIITETAWPSEDTVSGVTGSYQAQIDYIIELVQQAHALKVKGLVWVFPHDFVFDVAGGIFNYISLLDNDGNPKPGFEYWEAIKSLPVEE